MSDIHALILMACAAAGLILFCWARSAAEQVETTWVGGPGETVYNGGIQRSGGHGDEKP